MLKLLLIGPEDGLVRDWKDKLPSLVGVHLRHQVYGYPSPADMLTLIEEHSADAVVVNLADHNQVCRSIGRLGVERPHLPLIGLHSFCDQGLLLDLMQLGVRELWFQPLKIDQMQNAVNRLLQLKTAAASPGAGRLLAFLPARGGCGSTSLAITAAAFIQRRKGPVLFADFDFHNSIVAFWLKLEARHGFQEALERAHWLDDTLWKSMVLPFAGLDVLTSPQAAGPVLFSSSETSGVLEYARRNYSFVVVDLPEAIYTSCWEVLDRADVTYLVVTPEMASLYLARRKVAQLVNHGIPRDRIQVLLNRVTATDLQAGEVEKFLTLPVAATFDNQYKVVTKAFADGRMISDSSKLGAQIALFAEAVAGPLEPGQARPGGKKSAVRKLKEIFA